MKKICFVMDSLSFVPTGGAKMIFEYANRLQNRGYSVQILYLMGSSWKKYHLPEKLRQWMLSRMTYFSPSWFPQDKKIETLSYYQADLDERVKETDVFIATEVTTVESIKERFFEKKLAYFIQGYENWRVSDEYCQNTYKYEMTNIVISQWLKNIVDQYSRKPSILVRNPVDIHVYRLNTPIKERKLHTIGLLYHEMPHKGLQYSMKAVYQLKEKYLDLEVYMFGVPKRPKEYPEWIHYTQKATQTQTVEIYNKVSVWLCATIDEGYGLTGLEAMACGDVLVSTLYTGVLEYAKDEKNALLSPVKDVEELVHNVERVFEDQKLRESLVLEAQKSVVKFSWEKAVADFEKALEI